MIDLLQPSPFTSPDAVTEWDTWFRWREDGRLRDLSIEATWQRVAGELSRTEATDARRWAARFFDVQSRWRLIFDERILARAGTGDGELPADCVAVLNAAAFVTSPLLPAATFDFEAFRTTAALAVRGLDNVLSGCGGEGKARDLRVGLIGVADALALLGKRYDGAAGRVQAEAIARSLAEGCLSGSVRLGTERGTYAAPNAMPLLMRSPELPADLVAESARHGVRHRRLTEISSQARLARFSNDVSDALDPVEGKDGGSRSGSLASAPGAVNGNVSLSAQIALRGAVQPWIDAPIDYPFRVAEGSDAPATGFLYRLADAYQLGTMTFAGA